MYSVLDQAIAILVLYVGWFIFAPCLIESMSLTASMTERQYGKAIARWALANIIAAVLMGVGYSMFWALGVLFHI